MTSIIIIVFHYIIASVNSNTHNLLPCSQAVGSGQVKPRIFKIFAWRQTELLPDRFKDEFSKEILCFNLTWC